VITENAYGAVLAELAGIRRRLEEGSLDPNEVERLMAQAARALDTGRGALRRAEATIEVLEVGR